MNISAYIPHKIVKNKSLISLTDTSREDIFEYLYLAREFKRQKTAGEKNLCLTDKYIALISKPYYIRSRAAFQIAATDLGAKTVIIPLSGPEIDEALKDRDIIRNLSDYGISSFVVDTAFFHDAEIIENYAKIPIVNANGKSSPCQALAALLTIWENFGKLQGLNLTYVGNANDSENSLLSGAAKCGMNVCVVSPEEFAPDDDIVNYCSQFSFASVANNMDDGVRGADVIYVSENDFPQKYSLTDAHLTHAKKDAIVLHSIPLNRDKDISDETADGSASKIFAQSANWVPVLKSALYFTVK